jgi:hypothetical protein
MTEFYGSRQKPAVSSITPAPSSAVQNLPQKSLSFRHPTEARKEESAGLLSFRHPTEGRKEESAVLLSFRHPTEGRKEESALPPRTTKPSGIPSPTGVQRTPTMRGSWRSHAMAPFSLNETPNGYSARVGTAAALGCPAARKYTAAAFCYPLSFRRPTEGRKEESAPALVIPTPDRREEGGICCSPPHHKTPLAFPLQQVYKEPRTGGVPTNARAPFPFIGKILLKVVGANHRRKRLKFPI